MEHFFRPSHSRGKLNIDLKLENYIKGTVEGLSGLIYL